MTGLFPVGGPWVVRVVLDGDKAMPVATDEKVLVLRTCNADMTSHEGFRWPESGRVECPDWDPAPGCGGGLHGLLWGEGDWLLLGDADAKWLVVEVSRTDVVVIDSQKVKFRAGDVIYCGGMAQAVTMVLTDPRNFARLQALAKDKGTATAGDLSGAAATGDCSAAAVAGDYSTAGTAGHRSTATVVGNYSRAAAAGNGSTAVASWDYSTAGTLGNLSRAAAAGAGSRAAAAGDGSTAAAAGNLSRAAAAGDGSNAAASGYGSRAEATGNLSTAAATGDGSRAGTSGN